MDLFGDHLIDSLEEDMVNANTHTFPTFETQGHIASVHSGPIPMRMTEHHLEEEVSVDWNERNPKTRRWML